MEIVETGKSNETRRAVRKGMESVETGKGCGTVKARSAVCVKTGLG